MDVVYKIWRVTVIILMVFLFFFTLVTIPKALYSTSFAEREAFLPYNCKIVQEGLNYTDWYYDVGNSGPIYVNSRNGQNVDTTWVKTILEYGFNYSNLVFKIKTVDDNIFFLKPEEDTYITRRYNKLNEYEVVSTPRFIWINLYDFPLFYTICGLIDMCAVYVIIPIIYLICCGCILVFFFKNHPLFKENPFRFYILSIMIFVYPLICVFIYYLVLYLWRFGLWMYTFI